jgi:hypothetical protein
MPFCAEFHYGQSRDIRRIPNTSLCHLDYLLCDHLGYRIVPVNEANAVQCLLVSRRYTTDVFGFHGLILQKAMYRHG